MNKADCIFCRIVAGDLPSSKLREDGDTLAFMDIGPIIHGHALVIPKPHYVGIHDTPPELLKKLICAVRAIAEAQTKALGADGVNVIQSTGESAGQIVPHIHFHVIPRFKNDGHSWNWRPRPYSVPTEMEKIAQAIRSSLMK